jgi:hypothetical protein
MDNTLGKMGHNPPLEAECRLVLTAAIAAGNNGLTFIPQFAGARDNRFLIIL